MSQSPKKQNFLQGAALLAISVAIVKVIGAIYKIPLRSVIGDGGFSYFSTAYDIYTVLLTISTAGLPIAMSRMISHADSLGHYNRIRHIYKVAKTIYLAIGIVSTLIMALFCSWLANIMGQNDAWTAILALSPCCLLMGYLSAYRGFFQGQSNMMPTSVSQVLEAFFKLVVGLAAAFIIKRLTGNEAWAAAGAILGVTVSCLISALYLNRRFSREYQALAVSHEEVESFRKTTGELLSVAIPITIGSVGLQLLNLVEIGIYMDRLEELLKTGQYRKALIPALESEVMELKNYAADKHHNLMASSLKGVYNFAYTIFNMPCAFIIPINTSVLPAITASLTLGDHKAVRSTEESAARITGLLAAPCAVGIAVLATPIMGLLGGYEGEKLLLAGEIMMYLGIAVFLYCVVMFTNVMLQSHGKAHIPVYTTLACGVAKIAAMYFMVSNPNIGIVGVPICSILCYLGVAILNLIAIRVTVPQKPALFKNLIRALLPAAFMGVAVYFCHWALVRFAGISSNLLLCGIPVVIGVVIYLAGVVITRTITREDCLLLPKGEKIADLLKL